METSPGNSTLVSMETNPQKKDIERFVKFFLIKSVQIVVSSRVNGGRKVRSECRLPNQQQQADWFNLQIPDDPPPPPPQTTPTNTVTPTLLQTLHPHLGHTLNHYSITIATHLTTEDITIPLEIWRFHVDARNLQPPRDVYNTYNRLGLMIKSLICVSRATPGYKIARKSGPDVAIGYEIKSDLTEEDFADEKIVGLLGEGFKKVLLGKVPISQSGSATSPTEDSTSTTPTASITTSLFYRTKMELFTSQKESLLIKSDHYGDPVAMATDKDHVRPAFGSVDQIIRIDDGEEEEDDFFKMLRPPPSTPPPSVEAAPVVSMETVTSPTKIPTSPTQNPTHIITLPFATHFPSSSIHSHSTPTNPTQNPTHSTNSSNNSESELLNLFEEFRIAPVTLQAFDENSNHGNQGVLLEQFEGEIGFYDDFFGKTLLCGEE